jgi:hypothetical protein
MPSGANCATKPAGEELFHAGTITDGCMVPCVVGRLSELVDPTGSILPAPSMAIDDGLSEPLPPKHVLLSTLPEGSSRTRKLFRLPVGCCYAPAVTGKSGEVVCPTTKALPAESTAMAVTASALLPARVALYTMVEPSVLNFTIEACPENVLPAM